VREHGVTRNRWTRISGGKVVTDEARKAATLLPYHLAIDRTYGGEGGMRGKRTAQRRLVRVSA